MEWFIAMLNGCCRNIALGIDHSVEFWLKIPVSVLLLEAIPLPGATLLIILMMWKIRHPLNLHLLYILSGSRAMILTIAYKFWRLWTHLSAGLVLSTVTCRLSITAIACLRGSRPNPSQNFMWQMRNLWLEATLLQWPKYCFVWGDTVRISCIDDRLNFGQQSFTTDICFHSFVFAN